MHAIENGGSNSSNDAGLIEESSNASKDHFGHNVYELFQMKSGCHADLSALKTSELVKLNTIDNVPVHSLFNIVYKILDESMERKNEEILQRLPSLLKKIVQAIEQRISAQLACLRNKNDLYRARGQKYESRIQVLETLARGTTEEIEVVNNQLQGIKIEKAHIEEQKRIEELDADRLMKEKSNAVIEVSSLKKELEMTKKAHETHSLQLKAKCRDTKENLEMKLKELESLLSESRRDAKERDILSETVHQRWKKKELNYQNFIKFQFGALQDLKATSGSIKQEVMKRQRSYSKELNFLGSHLKGLADVAGNYHTVLAENRRLYNEVQDLKGNIRVYCRIRPFLPGQTRKLTAIEYVGENGELVVVNPLKQAKDTHRLFKFNKVYGPSASQEEVFLDTQPLIRSVLDGYNVCIFAYGQTGSGKTYTMTGPNILSVEDWGVNYRALNDLFSISQSRKGCFMYEIQVQMVEIYNEQVRDLLSADGSQKKLEIWNSTKPNGLAVPDASMHPVKSMADVLDLMNIGFVNRAVGATALNERSSRSHCVLTIHVRGMDLKMDTVLHGNLHLIDLAGSERVDRSEATGDRLREAQHINKSLSALGDVISALAQKSSHVPYRNSKLTQVLQGSLGGRAKTLMFVQLNPDLESYSETISTLKFAERVSGVELGTARSNKEGRDVRGLMEQVASLKHTIEKKDDEIEQLRILKLNGSGQKCAMSSPKYGSPSLRRRSLDFPRQSRRVLGEKGLGHMKKAASDLDNCSELSDKQSETASPQWMDDFGRPKEFFQQSKAVSGNAVQSFVEDVELFGIGNADSEERLSDISDGDLSMGTETDGSMCSVVEFTLFPETAKPAENMEGSSAPSKLSKLPQKQSQTSTPPLSRSSSMASSKSKKLMVASPSTKQPRRWQ